jgi:hypothetical protein
MPNSKIGARPESNRYDLAIDGFSYLPQLSLPLRMQRLGSGLSLHHVPKALGATRLVSTPSESLRLGSGLASVCTGSVPRIWAVLLSTFPLRHSNRLSPLRLPIPPREHRVGSTAFTACKANHFNGDILVVCNFCRAKLLITY